MQRGSWASDTFRWCHQHGIKVATDTGFHRVITEAIMEGLGWIRDGLVDLFVDVQHIPGRSGARTLHDLLRHDQLNIQSVHEVIKIGDTPADLLEGGMQVAGASSGAERPSTGHGLGKYWHTT